MTVCDIFVVISLKIPDRCLDVVSIAFPRFLYKMAAQLGWRQMIKENGGKVKDLGNTLE